MKRLHVSIVIVILSSATLVSFSYAGANCCDPGAGCCGTPNTSGDQQRLRVPSTGSDQSKIGTVKRPAPQINRTPWSATVYQIGTRLVPPSVSPGCCPGTNSTAGCCESAPKSALVLRADTSMVDDILAFNIFLGTLW